MARVSLLDSSRSVTPVHRSSSRSHGRRVASALLFLLILSRVVEFTSGCGPKAGTQGGKCNDNGCNTYCDDGLQCDNASNTCVSGGGDVGLAPQNCTTLLDSFDCAPGLLETCIEGTTPDPVWNGACTLGKKGDTGDAVFCCDTTKPFCLSVGSDCPSPSAGYYCHDLPAPPLSAGTQCAFDFANDAGVALCCASEDTCFAGSASAAAMDCAVNETEIFCTGPSASPFSPECRPVTSRSGSFANAAQGYCCPGGGDAGTVDQGGDSGTVDGGGDAGTVDEGGDGEAE
jgi:hypothetical protein